MTYQPFDKDNLIFIDTEFTSLDPAKGELLSIGIVKSDGSSLYIELAHSGPVDPWVKKNILPTLSEQKHSLDDAKKLIKKFIGRTMPYAVAYVDNYDNLYMVKLFGVGKLPFKWMTLDFSTVLFMHGIDPAKLLASGSEVRAFYESLGLDMSSYKPHHALDDARMLRDVWMAFVEKAKL